MVRSSIATAIALLGVVASPVRADKVDKIAKKLVQIDQEVNNMASGLSRPTTLGGAPKSGSIASRRLIDARVNIGLKNYDAAAIILYDYVEKYPSHKSWDEGVYYLAEALFQKGDNVAARTYFARLVREVGPSSDFYQQALQRLIELTLRLDDATDIDEWMGKLDSVPARERRASVAYVRGKYSHAQERYDEALAWFRQVPKKSEYGYQARYFVGVCYVDLGDLGKAADVFRSIGRTRSNDPERQRIIQLSYMALGRIYYERDQSSKAIDEYLNVNRKSDLFQEALYEVAWVYVKNKEFEKALRALELLALADPTSERTPEVRILEGNLRIRKAQAIERDGKAGNSKEEYDKALRTFEDTRDTFKEPRDELLALAAENDDASVFLAQITGRHSDTFETHATLPPVAAAWLRKEPDVERVVHIETDLAQIEDEIAETEATIRRLEAVLGAGTRVNIFPSLAEKRIRATELEEELMTMRRALIEQQRKISGGGPEADRLAQNRKRIEDELTALPDSGLTESERIGQARNRFTDIDKRSSEVQTLIGQTEAQLVALEKYAKDQGVDLTTKEMTDVAAAMRELRTEIDSMKADLEQVRAEAVMARDQAGTGDEVTSRRRQLREQLSQALAEEQAYLARSAGGAKGQQIASLGRKITDTEAKLDRIRTTIESVVDSALGEVQTALAEEKSKIVAYRSEFETYEQESRQLGGEIIGLSFDAVARKFYEILIKSDVGVVDVAWSLKESADQAAKRLTIDQARQLRTLDAEFAEVIREIRDEREAEAQKKLRENLGTGGSSGGDSGGGGEP